MTRIIAAVLSAFLLQSALARAPDPGNFVIENVLLTAENLAAARVNLLVRDNKLELLSEDEIPIPDGFIALDAKGGYLMGQIELDASPSFMILDADPAADFEVLLDLDAHIVFAVHENVIRQNTLLQAEDMFQENPEIVGWHAYSPPPVALPTVYQSANLWNHWTTDNTQNALFGVVALDRQFWLTQNSGSETQVGVLEDIEGGEIRDFRFGAYGSLNYFDRPWGYTVVVATNAFDKRFELDRQSNLRALDYRLDIPLTDDMKLSVGKQKEPISMERIMTLIHLPMQERSAPADAMLLSRNFGVLLSGNALDRRMSWAAGVFNEFIDTDQSIDEAPTSFSGRLTWLPYVSEDQSELIHLALAGKSSNGNNGFLYRAEPEFNKSPFFVDTGEAQADRINQYNVEASWRRGPFWVVGEYTESFIDSPTEGTLDFSGYYVTGSWIVTGEMREYKYNNGTFGPVPIARSIDEAGFGAIELGLRWSSIDLDDGSVSGGNMDILSLGANWWLSPVLNINANYRYIENDRFDLNGITSGANLRMLLKLR